MRTQDICSGLSLNVLCFLGTFVAVIKGDNVVKRNRGNEEKR